MNFKYVISIIMFNIQDVPFADCIDMYLDVLNGVFFMVKALFIDVILYYVSRLLYSIF